MWHGTGWLAELAHGATGASLAHCGWGSTVKSFIFWAPRVMLPFVLDEPLATRTMAEKGVNVEVARDEVEMWLLHVREWPWCSYH